MSQETIIANTKVSFKDFLFKNKRNRTILWIAAAAIMIQFAIFKYFYPFASFIHGDSFTYLETAYQNLSINTYMIGYSMFLRLFSIFSTSDFALTAFQYLLMQSSVLFLLFTINYFYTIRKWIQITLIFFMVFNPLFLYMSNLVSSDSLFASISMFWFTTLLWIIYKPSFKLTIFQTLLIFIAFTIRYNALIYLFISAAAFYLSPLKIKSKILGVTSSVLTILLFIIHTSFQYKSLTGTFQYSPFAGWQLANNAMYAYRYVDSADRLPVSNKYKILDAMIRAYFDSTRNTVKFPVETMMASTVYMWSPGLPLFKYRDKVFINSTEASNFKKWATMGPIFKSYGLYIIKRYPGYFLRYFIWPNANKYYAPPIEFLSNFNSGKDDVTELAQKWFGYKTRNITTRTKDLKINLLNFFPILSGMINVLMLFGLLCFFLLQGYKQKDKFRKGILLGGILWIFNAGFTIFASSAALRFQSFPILLTTIYSGLLFNWLANIAFNRNSHEVNKNKEKMIQINSDLVHRIPV